MKLFRLALPLIVSSMGAQVLNIIATPLLTSFYTAEQFGIWAFFLAITSVTIAGSAFRYDISIVLPTSQVKSFMLSIISFQHVIVTTLVTLIFTMLYFFMSNSVNVIYLLIPLSVFLGGLGLISNANLNTKKKYKVIATSKFIQTFLTVILNLFFVLLNDSDNGGLYLIISTIAGQGVCLCIQLKSLKVNYYLLFNSLSKKYRVNLAKKYSDFAIYSLPEVLLGTFLRSFPIYILAYLFTTTEVGQYSLAQRLLLLPMAIIATSMSQVYLKSFSLKAAKKESILKDLIYIWLGSFTLGLVPAFIVFFYVEPIFLLVFDKSWLMASEIIKWLVFPTLIRFVFTMGSSSHAVLRMQNYSFYFSVIALLGKLLCALCFNNTVIELLVSFAIVDIIVMFIMNYLVLIRAKRK